jgi:hypothetical protein
METECTRFQILLAREIRDYHFGTFELKIPENPIHKYWPNRVYARHNPNSRKRYVQPRIVRGKTKRKVVQSNTATGKRTGEENR